MNVNKCLLLLIVMLLGGNGGSSAFAAGPVKTMFPGRTGQKVIFLSGAGMKEPVQKIAANYKKKTGVDVITRFAGSTILRDYVSKFKTGGVFLSGDKENLDLLDAAGFVSGRAHLGWHKVAILISPEMKDRINGLHDLASGGMRVVMSNPELASLGRLVKKRIIDRHPNGGAILENVVVYGSSSLDVLEIYRGGGVDAVIEWDTMAATPAGEGLTVVPIEEPYNIREPLIAALLSTACNTEAANNFFEYLKTNGPLVFRDYGYDIGEQVHDPQE